MTLTDVASIGSLARAIAVLVSLIFVDPQAMQNTRAIQSQIHQDFTDGWIRVGAILSENARSFAEGIASDEKTFAAMPDEDKMAYMSKIFVFFKQYENM